MRTATFEELMDTDSDFNVERHAEEAQRLGNLAARMADAGREVLAGGMAWKAATAGRRAMEIIERRASDDIEFFC